MKRIFTLILALSLLALTACSGGGTGETDSLTPEERTQRFVTAITDARSEEDNEYNSILSSADDDTADMTFQLLGVTAEDMESFAFRALSTSSSRISRCICLTSMRSPRTPAWRRWRTGPWSW